MSGPTALGRPGDEQLAGHTLGPYVLDEPIGHGSAATVYRAFHVPLSRTVAVKVARGDSPGEAARFHREARALARLSHPHVLPIYDYGEHGTLCYLVMPLIEGGMTLRSLLDTTPLQPVWALHTMATVLDALDAAHRRNIVHRDLKPSNVLLRGGSWPLLADFGIAALSDESSQLTLPGRLIGTALYMSPERALGQAASPRSDVYAAGVLLYELLAGSPPFSGAPLDVLSRHVSATVPPLSDLDRRLAAVIEPLVQRAMEKDPARRYAGAATMAQALRDGVAELRQQPPLRATRPVRRPATQAPVGKPPAPDAPASTRAPLPLPLGLVLLLAGVVLAGLLGAALPALWGWLVNRLG